MYIGVTGNIRKRVYEHKRGLIKGFTSKYKVHKLVYFEIYEKAIQAIAREKALKNWKRMWKNELITKHNPNWEDLYRGF